MQRSSFAALFPPGEPRCLENRQMSAIDAGDQVDTRRKAFAKLTNGKACFSDCSSRVGLRDLLSWDEVSTPPEQSFD